MIRAILFGVVALAAGAAHASTTIFLDRCAAGCTYTAGVDDSRQNRSSVVSQERALPAFAYSDASWNALVACVQDKFAPFDDTQVTDVDPGDVDHLEIAVAGWPEQLGLPAGIENVAPFTCAGDRVVANGIGFAFADLIGDLPDVLCWYAAQAAGTLLGLDHVRVAGDVMTVEGGYLPKRFLDETGDCGESQPRACQCGGTTQNSYRTLGETLPEPGALAGAAGALAALALLARRRSA